MPNSRRRRFSVQHNIVQRNERNQNKSQNGSQLSQSTPDKITKDATQVTKQPGPKLRGTNNDTTTPLDNEVKKNETLVITCADKDVTATSSNIDLYDAIKRSDNFGEMSCNTGQEFRHASIRDRYCRQHRVKVRSPKRRAFPDPLKSEKITVGLNAIDWDQEMEEYIDLVNVAPVAENVHEERTSNHSIDDMCRICHGGEALSPELGLMISACACRGTVGRVHVKCLEKWLTESGKSRCELCGTRYATRRVHRYGLPKALIMWLLSQNAKQLMIDTLGLMLMSPLAVLAAWLSGRTLSGLMTPEAQVTPWPLASTFVLACMTLVCYYCWIVSAATRHALGWWIWYRSQYEVRLQFQENEE